MSSGLARLQPGALGVEGFNAADNEQSTLSPTSIRALQAQIRRSFFLGEAGNQLVVSEPGLEAAEGKTRCHLVVLKLLS